jgi:hypothetical protein
MGNIQLKSLAGPFGAALAVLLCSCGSLVASHFRLAETDRAEVIVREFDASDEVERPLGVTVARHLAEILQNRGILAPIVAVGEPLPPDAHALIEGRISYAGRGTLTADARLVDLDRDKVLLQRRFRRYAMPLFGEELALHRDAAEIGRAIAEWATVRRD